MPPVDLILISFKRMYPQTVPKIPMGMLIQKIDCQPNQVIITPPRVYPAIAPKFSAMILIPSPIPNSFFGKASVRIAPLLATSKAAPAPCRNRNTTSCSPLRDNAQSSEPMVNIVNPMLYNRTRPYRSARRPRATSRIVTIRV